MQLYTEKFKKAAVKKLLQPGVSQNNLAIKLNISTYTLKGWKKKYASEVIDEVEQDFFITIQPEEEEKIDIDKIIAEYDRKDFSNVKRNEEEVVEKILEKKMLPEKYKMHERYAIINKTRNLKEEERGMFCRRAGLQGNLIKLWEEELLSMGKKEIDKNAYIKKIENENKELQKKLREAEKEKKELKILIELKKKYQSLFSENEED